MPALGAKLRIPTARRTLVPRDRLAALLPSLVDGGAAPRLVLVAAPAGFGKTTLLTQWLTAVPDDRATAWLSLDPGDSDLRRFLSHLVAAVRASGTPEVGAEAAALLDADVLSAEDVLASLVNDLDTGSGPAVIALDDYHVVDGNDVHQAMTFLLDNLPPHVTVAMTTRADPPLPVARLRARGELVEVRADDLRFTDAEAAELLNEAMGLHLGSDHVAALGERTEGWAAGLQLAGLSARTRGDDELAEFVASFSGSHRFVLDYLLEEVLASRPEEVRTFLLQTSVLTQLTAGLCDALTGRTDSQGLLERLEADGMFVTSLDDERRWFRYHHLFADALQARLPSDLPGQADALHGAAARWLAEHGMLADAIHHALAGHDQAYAADLVELALADQRRRRQDPTLRDWADRLETGVVRERPLLATFVGWSRLAQGDVDGVEPWLDAAESRMADVGATGARQVVGASPAALADRDEELRSLPSMISVYRAAVAQARGDTAGTLVHARRAWELAGETDHFARGAAAGFLGQAAWAVGDLVTAVDTFSEAVRSLEAAGMTADALGSTVVLAQMWLGRGDVQRARTLYQDALTTASRHPGPLSTTGDLHVGLADVLREQGDLAAAEEHLQRARALGDRASLPENRHRWFVVAAGLRRAFGDPETTEALLDRAEELYLPGYFPDVRPIASTRARLWIAAGRLADARAWADRRGVAVDDPVTFLAEHELLTLARLLVAEGRPDDAQDVADRVLTAAEEAGRQGSVVETLVVRALARGASADEAGALEDLGRALTLGVPAGWRRVFLDDDGVLPLLTSRAGGGDDVAEHARHVLERAAAPSVPDAPETDHVLVDPISERELEVLRLLDTELSGPDIARRLFVSINTLRTHTRHVYDKLGVNTRRAAVRRAAELGLL